MATCHNCEQFSTATFRPCMHCGWLYCSTCFFDIRVFPPGWDGHCSSCIENDLPPTDKNNCEDLWEKYGPPTVLRADDEEVADFMETMKDEDALSEIKRALAEPYSPDSLKAKIISDDQWLKLDTDIMYMALFFPDYLFEQVRRYARVKLSPYLVGRPAS